MTEPTPSAPELWAHEGIAYWRDLIPDIETRAAPFRVSEPATDAEIREIFCDHLAEQLGAARNACAAHDAEAVRALGHSLQGAGGTVGLAAVSVVGLELCSAARAGEWDRCSALLERLQQWLTAARRGPGP
ncbi:MAG: Hpt domain-containing protein [Kiritimatiellae bacterium]|nr:Hpt domain-containing protein [Kiritimatiellia bacterium]